MSKEKKDEFLNQCPFCKSSSNGYESILALKTHITLFHTNIDIEKDSKTKHIITKASKELQ